ncbi:ABC transporter permease [Dyella subtropica]|uniref:ABC transporter permease n=1 Tax=Dyella subtropica TaxID=2992127 RepID=UPI002257EAE2|nr:ABC transporter permease [Dyella subtropica]
MFSYYLDLAVRSLKRSPGLTALMVLAIGFGVAASMTTWSVFRAVSGDPIPWKSSKLFVPQIDVWGPQGRSSDGEPPNAMAYPDAMVLMRDHRAKLQSAMYQISPSVVPAQAGRHPLNVSGHAVYSEFFPMLDVPFLYGSGWNASDDTQRTAVVVISSKLNQKLFAGANSVGKTLNIESKDYRVVGVLDNWNPQPRYYDVVNSGGFSATGEDVFLPFERAIEVGMSNDGNTNCNAVPAESGFVGLQHSNCVWIAYMAQLDDAAAVTAYRNYLDGYAHAQQQAGRFGWAVNNRLRDLPAFLDNQHVVPSDTKVSLLVAIGLLLVCLVNTVGLLLAKFLRRSGEIGVRRALGAPRSAIYAQFLTEAGIIGAAGGVLGLLLTGVGVACVGWVLPKSIATLARLDLPLLALTLLVAVVATLLAGLYPTSRAARVQPAWQLKSN